MQFQNHVHESTESMHGLHKLILSTNKMAVRNRMCIGGKKLLNFIRFWLQQKGIKPDLKPVKCFNFSMRCKLCPPITLSMACKERHKLCMNRASLYRESLDGVSTTH